MIAKEILNKIKKNSVIAAIIDNESDSLIYKKKNTKGTKGNNKSNKNKGKK